MEKGIVISSDELFRFSGITEEEDLKLLKSYEDITFKALEGLYEIYTENEDLNKPLASASLLIPGKKYHIGLKNTSKSIFQNAIRIVGLAITLNSLNLFNLSFILTSMSIHNLFRNITKLTPLQTKIVETVLRIKKEKALPKYSPTTIELVSALDDVEAESELLENLNTIVNKVIRYEEGRWSIIF